MKFDLDPTPQRVALIGVCLFIEALLTGILVIAIEGELPSVVQWVVILCMAGMAIVTHFLAFLRSEEETET